MFDDPAETYAVDPFFADEAKTALELHLNFVEGLWWKRDFMLVPALVN